MPERHFHFESFEVIRGACLSFPAHLLAGPLLEAIELLVDIHACVFATIESRFSGRISRAVLVGCDAGWVVADLLRWPVLSINRQFLVVNSNAEQLNRANNEEGSERVQSG